MNIEYMREFLLTAKTLNFSAAAEQLFISQSTLSRHISMLENEVGSRLFIRNPHAIILTEEGKQVYLSFERILAEYDALLERLSKQQRGLSGSLRIGLLYYIIEDYIAPRLGKFQRAYPDIRLTFQSYQPHQLIRDLLQDRIDIGPVIQTGFSGAEQFQFHPITKDTFIAVMPGDHPLSKRSSIRLKDLENEVIINLKDDPESTAFGLNVMKQCGFIPSRTVLTDQIDSVSFTVLDTGGIFITGSCLAKLPFPGLAKVPIEDKGMEYEMFFAYKHLNQNPALPLLIKSL